MKQLFNKESSKGFTLMEIVIVFILLGILAIAVIPSFTTMDNVGHKANQEGVLGTLRTAWSSAYGDSASVPTLTAIAAKVDTCSCGEETSGEFVITCTGIFQTDGSTDAEFGLSTAASACTATVSKPSDITIYAAGAESS
ncbi:MAG: type II secretion system protein [Gammaproteobacteria bacterium]|nr:type II secretion system protein [Gammaproteobacteria bacterium]MBT7306751.1 type II secretion system protein [Gammaproteobacteria bacterium]